MASPPKPPSPELQAFLQQEQAKAQVRKRVRRSEEWENDQKARDRSSQIARMAADCFFFFFLNLLPPPPKKKTRKTTKDPTNRRPHHGRLLGHLHHRDSGTLLLLEGVRVHVGVRQEVHRDDAVRHRQVPVKGPGGRGRRRRGL